MLFTWPLENRAKSRGNRVSTKSANSGLAGLVRLQYWSSWLQLVVWNCKEPEQESLTHLLNQNKMTYSLLTPSLNQGCSALLFVTRVGVSTASSTSQLQTLKANWSISLLVGGGMVECFTEWNSMEASSLHEMWEVIHKPHWLAILIYSQDIKHIFKGGHSQEKWCCYGCRPNDTLSLRYCVQYAGQG